MDRKTVIQELSQLNHWMTIHVLPDDTGLSCIDNAISLLKGQEPVDIEIEGGGHSWWYVCEECRGAVDSKDSFCRHCGRPFRKGKCAGCKDDCQKDGDFVCPNGKL